VNAWLVAAAVLLVIGLLPALAIVSVDSPVGRLEGLALGSVVTVAELVLLAQGFGRTSYIDVALVLAIMSVTGVLVFARFFGRTL
jgi:multisubunit Na+/H+ antiporter MnhF subunit